jgi:predicted MPP superfamily phosphohydrolase
MDRRPFLKHISSLSATLFGFSLTGFTGIISKKEENSRLISNFDLTKPTLKFITASDGHYGQPDTNYETSHQDLLEAIHKESNVDFVVFNGDLIHDAPMLMPEVKKVYDQLKVPYYVVKGNHDRISEAKWQEIWGQSADYFFKTKSNQGVLILNSSNEAGDYRCVDSEILRLKLEENKGLDQLFIFIHISQNDWTRHGIDCQEVLDLIGKYSNVKAVFHGHDHDVDGVMWNAKKPYFWSGHFGGSWGNPFPSYRVCQVDDSGKVQTALKRVADGVILNAHSI